MSALSKEKEFRATLVAWLVPAVLLLAGAAAAVAEDGSTAALRGRVLDAQTGEAIAKAAVTLPALQMSTSTDAAGRFTFAAVPEGDVELVVTTIGYGLGRQVVQVSAPTRRSRSASGQEALKRSEDVLVETPPFEPVDRRRPRRPQPARRRAAQPGRRHHGRSAALGTVAAGRRHRRRFLRELRGARLRLLVGGLLPRRRAHGRTLPHDPRLQRRLLAHHPQR